MWQVDSGSPVGNYRAHSGAVLSVIWMANEFIYTGGDDYILHSWKVDQCQNIDPPLKSMRSDKNNKKKRNQKKPSQKPQTHHKPVAEDRSFAKIEVVDTEIKSFFEGKVSKKKKFGHLSQQDNNSPLEEVLDEGLKYKKVFLSAPKILLFF